MAFADRPSSDDEGALEISRFSCMLFCQRARVLRLRRTEQPLACNAAAVLPSHYTPCSRHPDQPVLRSSIAGPTGPSVYASTDTSRCRLQDSRPGWSRCLLSCRGLAPPTTCRFIPALGVLRATLAHYDVWCQRMQFLCSCALSRKCWPELPRHTLNALAREFGISFRQGSGQHNAEEDAVAAALVVLRAAEEYSAESVEELLQRTSIRFGEVSTGKYLSCRRIPIPRTKKRGGTKLLYVPLESAD